MRAGELRHQITISNPTSTRNTLGEPVEGTPIDAGTVDAAIRPTSARETLMGTTLANDITHVITMRFTDVITPTSRLGFGDRTFEVAGLINIDELDIELQVLAKEVT